MTNKKKKKKITFLDMVFESKSTEPMPRYLNFSVKTPKKNSNLIRENAHIFMMNRQLVSANFLGQSQSHGPQHDYFKKIWHSNRFRLTMACPKDDIKILV
jgi:hypothetical protein